jgi:hypothetical protein
MFIGEFMCWVVYAAVQSFIPQRRTSCDDEATQPLLNESAGQSASSSSYDSDGDDASDVGSVTAIKEPVLAVEDHELEPSRHATSKPVMSGWAMLWMWIPSMLRYHSDNVHECWSDGCGSLDLPNVARQRVSNFMMLRTL